MIKEKKFTRLCGILAGILFLCMLVIPQTTVFAGTMDSGTESNNEVSEADEIGVSLYDTGTALTAYVNNVVGVNGNDKHQSHRVEDPVTVGNAGSYVGYGDSEKGFYESITASATYGITTSTYDSWLNVTEGSKNPIYAYTRFGHVLADSGLDATAGSGFSLIRGVYGVLSLLMYCFSMVIPELFGIALTLLRILNPFQFLSMSNEFSAYWKSAFPSGALSAFTPVIQFISWFFDWLCNEITWVVVVPLLLAIAAVQMLLIHHNRPQISPLVNVLKKVVFFAIGIPLCAGLYTGTLNRMQDVYTTDMSVGQIVVGTFSDFESWASNSQLAVPAAAYIESAPTDDLDTTGNQDIGDTSRDTESESIDSGVASAEMLRQLRTTAYVINQTNNEAFETMSSPGVNDHFMWSGNVWDNNPSAVSADDNQAFIGINNAVENLEQQNGIVQLILRYTSGAFYRSSDFEASFKNLLATTYRSDMGHRVSTGTASSNDGTVHEMMDRTDDVNDWMERTSVENNCIWTGSQPSSGSYSIPWSDSHLTWVEKAWNIYSDGELKSSGTNPEDMMVFTTDTDKKGLSTQAMYNYLSTSFDDNSIMIYSPSNSVSEMSKQQHYAVNTVGTGVLKIAFAANMIVILLVLVIVAFLFSVNLAIHNIKRGFSLIAAVPVAMIGALKSIVQVISYTFTMILELILCMFLYLFVSNLLVVVATVLETVASGTVSEGSVTAAICLALRNVGISDTNVSVLFAVILETVGVIVLIGFMLKYRRAYLRICIWISNKMYACATLPEMNTIYDQVLSGTKEKQKIYPRNWSPSFLYMIVTCLGWKKYQYQME